MGNVDEVVQVGVQTRGGQGQDPGDAPLKKPAEKRAAGGEIKETGRRKIQERRAGMAGSITCCTENMDGESPEDLAMQKSLVIYSRVAGHAGKKFKNLNAFPLIQTASTKVYETKQQIIWGSLLHILSNIRGKKEERKR